MKHMTQTQKVIHHLIERGSISPLEAQSNNNIQRLAADIVGKQAVEAFESAGEYYDFRCPITGEYKVGDNWADTHQPEAKTQPTASDFGNLQRRQV